MSTTDLIVEADGGSRGNPGVAGYGALVRDAATKTVLAERAAPLGKASNNVAEYTGMIAGLEAAHEIEAAAQIEVRMDSKLVVEQMAGRWKIKHEDMRRLALQAREVVRSITDAGGSVSFTWIPRAENSAADKLSNDGMDGHTVRVDHWRDGRQPGQSEAEPDRGGAEADQDAAAVENEVVSPDSTLAGGHLPGQPITLLLLRHGVTAFTESGRLDGRGGADPELSANGRAQAEAAGAGLAQLLATRPGRVRVLTSSLLRARQTGQAAASALGVETSADPDWDEQAFGDWDGAALRDLVRDHRLQMERLRVDDTFVCPGGESHVQLRERVLRGLHRILDDANPGETVVVATHRKPIMAVLADVLGLSTEHAWRIACAPGSLTGLEFGDRGRVEVTFTNDTRHLPG